MGRSRYRVGDPKAPHFVTCTILNWIALFTRPQTVDIILQALQYRQENAGWKVYGYVLLENQAQRQPPLKQSTKNGGK
jgi:hypothetical protein